MAVGLIVTLTVLLMVAVVGLRWHRARLQSQTVTMRQARLGREAATLAAYFGTWRPGDTPSLEIVKEIVGDLPLGETLAEILWEEHEHGTRPPMLKRGTPKYDLVAEEIGDFFRGCPAIVP